MDKYVSLKNYLICPDCSGSISHNSETNIFKCVNCQRTFSDESGIIIMHPLNLDKKKQNENNHYKTHSMEGEENPPWLALVHKRDDIKFLMKEFFQRNKHYLKGRILEIGSGTCWASSVISFCLGKDIEIIATDISPTALRIGIQVADLTKSEIKYFISCDGESLPFADESFDVIFGCAVLHHFIDIDRGLKEIFRVLKKGGVYLGMNETANNLLLKSITKSKFGTAGGRSRKHGITENQYSYAEWLELFRQTGFHDIGILLERSMEYKLQVFWFIPLYYKLISPLPDFIVKHLLASTISIVAKK